MPFLKHVRILKDGLTDGAKLYLAGEIEKQPSEVLQAMAKDPKNQMVEFAKNQVKNGRDS